MILSSKSSSFLNSLRGTKIVPLTEFNRGSLVVVTLLFKIFVSFFISLAFRLVLVSVSDDRPVFFMDAVKVIHEFFI